MLAYTANRPASGKRQSSPHALLFVISAHVAALAVLMSAKMDLPRRIVDGPIPIVKLAPEPPPPPGPQIKPPPHPEPIRTIDRTPTPLPLPPIDNPPVDSGPPPTDLGPIAGGGTNVITEVPKTIVTPIHHDPRLLTPASELKPPYPASKLLSEEEAVLTLRLSIDEHGRVVAVDPVGSADRAFVDAARRHLMAHWRYAPATEDGRAIASSLTVTLRFMLDG